jgi:hypothetical protein
VTAPGPTAAFRDQPDIPLHRVEFWVCDLCLSAAGGECHVPGCMYWLRDAPTGVDLDRLRAHFAGTRKADRDLKFALAANERLTATRDALFETRRRLEAEVEQLRSGAPVAADALPVQTADTVHGGAA